jgi:hypothetical protein
MLKKYILFIAISLIITLPLAAQEGVSDASDTTFWDFGFYGAPDYNARMISGDGTNGVTSAYLNTIELPRIGYTFGINMTRQLGKCIYIQTGIMYQNKGYKTSTLQDTVLDLYDHFYSSSEYYSISRYNALYVPVILRLKMFKAGSVQFNVGIGAAPEIYLAKSTLAVFSDHTERDITKAEQVFDVKGMFNLYIDVPLTKNLSLGFEPNFSYDILGLKDKINVGVKRNMYTAGLGIQLSYKVTDQSLYDYYYKHIYKKPPRTTF